MPPICASAYCTGKWENNSAGQPVPASSASSVAALAPMSAKAEDGRYELRQTFHMPI